MQKKHLVQAFTKTLPPSWQKMAKLGLAAAVLAGAGGLGVHSSVAPAAPSPATASRLATSDYTDLIVPLTESEAALARAIFGPDFDTASIRKAYHPDDTHYNLHPNAKPSDTVGAYVSPGERTVHLLDEHYHVRDHARYRYHEFVNTDGVTLLSHLSLFVHELAHIWQHDDPDHAAVKCDDYAPEMTANSRFEDFCNEEQAVIVALYASTFLDMYHPLNTRLGTPDRPYSEDHLNLIRIVEERFPYARQSRLALVEKKHQYAECIDDNEIRTNNPVLNPLANEERMHNIDTYNRCRAEHASNIAGLEPLSESEQRITPPSRPKPPRTLS